MTTEIERRPAPPVRYGARMLRRFGWFYHALGLGRTLGRVRLEPHSVEQIRTAAARGPLVYVLAHGSMLDHLTLNAVLNQRRLPLSVWANGATSFFWQPLGEAWRDLAHRVRAWVREGRRPDPVASGWVAKTVASGHPVSVFVEDVPRWFGRTPPDALAALLDAQSRSERPIQLVPVLVVWDRAPGKQQGVVRSFLANVLAKPSALSRVIRAWLGRGDPFVLVGAPLDLAELCARVEPERRVKALRTVLRRYLRRESRLVRGPRLLSRRDMKRIVLDNPPMRQLARDEAAALGVREEVVRRRMERDFDKIAANFRWNVIRFLHLALRPLWTRVFNGVDVPDEDLERVRTAMREGTPILVPCHKSHFDYVLLSWVFFNSDLIVPHVVAGLNLAIWPISILLRGAGGFFIQRSFGGERIFPAVFARYLRELVRQGYPVEFFIEGGRTRSGRLLRPKVGVLGMVLDAAEHRGRDREVTILPIALAYEQVAEEGVYARESGGETKKPESVLDLVRARSVLRRRFGRVYLRVGTPIHCGPLVDAPAWGERPQPEQRALLHQLGERIVHRIGEAMVVLPTSLVAMALLVHHRRGIRHAELTARCHRFRAILQARRAPEAASLAWFDQALLHALDRFVRDKRIRSHLQDGERVWGIVPEERITLDFYKNQVLHYVTTAAMAAAAVRALPDGPFTLEQVRGPFLFLSWLLRRELTLDPDRSPGELLQEGLDTLVTHGALVPDGAHLTLVDTERMGEIYGLLRSILESYALVLRHPLGRTSDPKALVTALQREGDSLLATGAVTRPEALSAVTLRNAVDAFLEEGVLILADGALSAHPELRESSLRQLSPMVD